MANFNPRLAPEGIVPVDLMAKILTPRKRGRPRKIPIKPASSAPAMNQPTLAEVTTSSSSNPVPAATISCKRASSSESPSPLDRSNPSKRLRLDTAFAPSDYDRWMTEWHEVKDLRLAGDISAPFEGVQDEHDRAALPPTLCRTPGIRYHRGYLRPNRYGFQQDESYSSTVVKVDELLRHFERLVSPHRSFPTIVLIGTGT